MIHYEKTLKEIAETVKQLALNLKKIDSYLATPCTRKRKNNLSEFDLGYDWARRAIEAGRNPYELLKEPERFGSFDAYDHGWRIACKEEIARIEGEALSKSPTPDLSEEAIKKPQNAFEWLDYWHKVKDSFDHSEPKLEVGKWYKYKELMVVYQGEGVQTYGKGDHGWYIKATFRWDWPWELASDEEVSEMLIDEAWRRYEGKKIELITGEVVPFEEIRKLTYDPFLNALRAQYKQYVKDLFYNGEWVQPAKSSSDPVWVPPTKGNPLFEEAMDYTWRSFAAPICEKDPMDISLPLKNRLPIIHGWSGKSEGGLIKYGCLSVAKDTVLQIHSIGITDFHIKVDGEEIYVTEKNFRQIYEYLIRER